MKKLRGCAVREGAERRTKAEADRAPKDLEAFVAGTIACGTCKLEQQPASGGPDRRGSLLAVPWTASTWA